MGVKVTISSGAPMAAAALRRSESKRRNTGQLPAASSVSENGASYGPGTLAGKTIGGTRVAESPGQIHPRAP
jgi:hypothetical protein